MTSQPTAEVFQRDRDPLGNNDFIQVAYSDVICEPPAAHSPQCSYQFTKGVYASTLSLTYGILTLLFGGLLSFIYGLSCGVISFFFVWLVTPFVRAWLILLGLAGKVWLSFVKCFYDPCFESCGRIFSNVNITFRSGTIQNV
ncbi:Caveolin-1 [Porites harrisoni]